MPRKPVTIGYIPLIQGQPGRFGLYHIYYCNTLSWPLKIERSRATVCRQIAQTRKFRASEGFAAEPADKYTVLRVVG